HGLMGKQNLFDHSLRVPLMVCGPDVPKDKKLKTPVYLQDIMASSLDLGGIDKPAHVQFKSLMPIIAGKRAANYDAIYGGYLGFQRAVIVGDHKLLLYPGYKKVLLFNLADDPDEMKDLAAEAKNKPLIKKLFARLLKLQKETGDTFNLKSVYPSL
ncbi:MAG: choline-sulfatase, partial [Phycisphaerae bacterium]|nr:choline-sulfatase [Phycisphaerae bacterium]